MTGVDGKGRWLPVLLGLVAALPAAFAALLWFAFTQTRVINATFNLTTVSTNVRVFGQIRTWPMAKLCFVNTLAVLFSSVWRFPGRQCGRRKQRVETTALAMGGDIDDIITGAVPPSGAAADAATEFFSLMWRSWTCIKRLQAQWFDGHSAGEPVLSYPDVAVEVRAIAATRCTGRCRGRCRSAAGAGSGYSRSAGERARVGNTPTHRLSFPDDGAGGYRRSRGSRIRLSPGACCCLASARMERARAGLWCWQSPGSAWRCTLLANADSESGGRWRIAFRATPRSLGTIACGAGPLAAQDVAAGGGRVWRYARCSKRSPPAALRYGGASVP